MRRSDRADMGPEANDHTWCLPRDSRTCCLARLLRWSSSCSPRMGVAQVLFFFQPESCLEGKLMRLLDISELASRVNFNPIKGLGGRDLEILESIQACLVLA